MKTRSLKAIFASVLLALAALAPAQVKKVDEISYPKLHEFEVPEAKRVVLDNGMVVMLIEDHELPLVSVVARVRTGSRLEPADRIGLASLTGSVMRTGGTTKISGDQLDDFLESRAANISTSIGESFGSASMNCLKQDFADVLPVFADILRNPAFEEDKIKIAKNQVVAGISRQNDNPQQILFREFNEILYGAESPYARNPTYETIGNIKHQDLTQWHATYFHPNNVILGLIGDLDTQEALRKVQNAFGDWQRGPAAVRGKIAYNRTVQPGVYYVEKNDMTQSNIIMGHFGIQRDNPDYFAVEVLNYVLSGSFASRLFLNVRSKKGLAYSVRGAVGSNWDYLGTLNMWMTTKTETTGAGIEALLEEARNLRARPPTEEEVDKAKAGILNSFIFRIDTGRKILGQQLTYEYYGYPSDWLSRYRAGIENANLEQVRQAAIKYVHPDRFAILVVGPSEGRDKPLSEFGDVTAVDITIPEPEAPQVEVTAAGQEKGAAVIARAVKAAGGAEMIDSLKSFRVEATSLAHTPQGEMEIKTSTLIQVPDRFRQELSLPFGKITVVLTPDAAFQLTPRGVAAIPDSRRKEAAKGMLRNPMMILRSRNNADFVPIFAGSEELDGEPVDVVRLEIGGDPTTVVVDADGHIVQLRYRGVGLSGAPGDLVWTFSDFRQVEGFSYPFASSATRNGNPMVSSTVNSVTVNQPVDEALFKKPESK